MRYRGQGGEIAVGWEVTAPAVEAAFIAGHQALYGFTLESMIELVTVRIEATGRMPEPRHQPVAPGRGAAPVEHRAVHLEGGVADVPVYDRATLGAGDRFEGPAIITQLDATTFVAPGWSGEVHGGGALLLTFSSPS
jgi:N-methylhydantoinase A